MSHGKLRYRTTDGSLHLHRVGASAEDGWTVEVDPDSSLTRLPVGSVLLDLELVFSDTSAPRQRREAKVISFTSTPGKPTVAVLD